MKKILSMSLALVLLFSVFSFGVAQENPYAETIELTWMGYTGNTGDPIPAEDRIKSVIEEKFNVRITKADVDWTSKEQVSLYFAEGNRPDVMFIRQMDRNQLVDEELIRPIDEELLYEYMPDWMECVGRLVTPDFLKTQMYYQGQIWGVPYTSESRIAPYGYYINKTWYQQAGLSEAPKTMDELHDYLLYVSTGDPDGNGEQDTWGISTEVVNNYHYYGLNVLWAYFGVSPKSYQEIDGVIYASCQIPQYKEALAMARDWYAEGIIQPDFVLNESYDALYDLGANAKVGLFLLPVTYYYSTRVDTMAKDHPEYEYELYFGVEREDGNAATVNVFTNLYRNSYPYYFGVDTTDEQMIRGMQILNEFCVDPELALMTNFGEVEEHGANWVYTEEGVYKTNAEWNETVNGERSALERARDARCFYCILPSTKTPVQTVDSRDLYAIEKGLSLEQVYADINFNYAGVNTAASTMETDLFSIEDNYILNVILGRVDLDSTYEAFVDEWMSAGGAEVLAEYQELYEAAK